MWYKLNDDKTIQRVERLDDSFWVSEDRVIGSTEVDGIRISTVFLGIDHGFMNSIPVLFETMVFGGEHDGHQDRYSSYDEAVAGHEEAVKMVMNSLGIE